MNGDANTMGLNSTARAGPTDSPGSPTRLTFGARIRQFADESPDEIAVASVDLAGRVRSLSWRELDRRSNQMARLIRAHSPYASRFVLIAVPNGIDHVLLALAAWKLGACALPLNARATQQELMDVGELAAPALFVGDAEVEGSTIARLAPMRLAEADQYLADALPDTVSNPGKAIASGGSTGRPKIIVDAAPWSIAPGELLQGSDLLHLRHGQRQLICGPLYHNTPFTFLCIGLFEKHSIVLMERFDAALALRLIESQRIEWCALVPTMMKRMSDTTEFRLVDLSSLQGIFHTAAPCPEWVKQRWIDRIGAARVVELYGATEEIGFTIIRGDEWMLHRGSVGRPFNTQIRIRRADGTDAVPGEVGEIYLRRTDLSGDSFTYLGATASAMTSDGFRSVGDLGWLDVDGYLFIADRRVDLIISGGENVYPAEIESVIGMLPQVLDVAVVGAPDADLGHRIHAFIETVDTATPLTETMLREHCAERLAPQKRPKTYTIGGVLPRNEAGKLRRSALIELTRAQTGASPSEADPR